MNLKIFPFRPPVDDNNVDRATFEANLYATCDRSPPVQKNRRWLLECGGLW